MRKKINLLFISFISLLSCEDYLSESPDNRLELNTIEKVANLGARAYAQGSYIFTDDKLTPFKTLLTIPEMDL